MQYSWSLILQHRVKLPDSRYCKDALPVYSESPDGTYCIRQGQGQSTAVSAPTLQCNYTKFEAVLQNYRWVVKGTLYRLCEVEATVYALTCTYTLQH